MNTTPPLHEDASWVYVQTLLPADLEESARDSAALTRCRNIPNASALLRMALAYGLSDLSLKDVAAWASAAGVAQMSGPGFFYRLREAENWLAGLLTATLRPEVAHPGIKGLRLRVVDATVINGPGAEGTEWRIHARTDPATGCLCTIDLTDEHGGEGYGRHKIERDEVVLGDRAYATARGMYSVTSVKANVVARLNPHTLRVCDENRQLIKVLDRENEVPKVGVIEFNILVPIPPERGRSHKTWQLSKAVEWLPARIVAARTKTGEVIWIISTLPALVATAVQIMDLYRLRWQIELLFKRLKTLLHLDTLPSRQGPTARSWMYARMLAAALAQKLVQPSGPLSPYGYEIEPPRIHA
jgi:hypothetical protein